MAQFGSGKNPPWARSGTDFSSSGTMNQQMINPGVTTQVYNLAQQNMQTQFQAQQMAAASMQNALQQQAMLPQPGIAIPTSLSSSPNMGAVSYPTLKAQQAQQQPKQRVFTGAVTKLHDNFGFVDEDVFFQTTCVKGTKPKVGDRVLVEAQYNANMPFKWNAISVKVLNFPTNTTKGNSLSGNKYPSGLKSGFGNQNMPGSHPQPLMDQSTTGRLARTDRNRSGNRGFDRPRRRDERRDRERDKSGDHSSDRKRSKSPKRSESPASSKRSHSPIRRRNRVIPRYVVQAPKVTLNMIDSNVVALRSRYNNMYIPSDFFNAEYPWTDAFPLLRPFQLGKPCHFHVMHKEVERVGQNTAVLDPPDADHLFSAKVMLIASPSLDDLYHKSCSLSQDPENMQDNFVHPTRLINFLVGVKGKNEPIAIGGPWSASLDGPNPEEDPKVLIKTAIRTTKALTGINLSSCTQWYRFAEVHYLRPEETHKGKHVPARVETSVIFLPDVWSCQPTHLEWETMQLAYKKQLQKKLAQLDGKDDSQEDEEEGDISIGEKKDPTHFSELDPKTMKIIDLRHELEYRNLSSKGLKSQLIARLTKVLKSEQEKEEEDAANKPAEEEEEEVEEKAKEEEVMETEVDEEQKKKDEEERKREEEKLRATMEKRYTIPEKTSILVYPNSQAKGGKFDCSVMSLSVLLDYRPEDNKEHSFEVSLFAELFNEMLMRDFGFNIYKAMAAAPEKPKEDKKDKEKDKDKDKDKDKKKEKEKEKEDEPPAKKKKTDDKDKKDSEKDKKSEEKDKESKDGDDKKEKEEKKVKKYRTVKPDLLLSCIYFDQNHTGYLLDKDVEEILHSIGLTLSRAQVKKLVQKVVARDTMNYRKMTDQPVLDEDKPVELPEIAIDEDKLAAGNMPMIEKKESGSTPRKRSARNENEPLTGMVMYNGAMVDIENVIERLNKGEKSIADFEDKIKNLCEERDQAKKDLKKKEDQFTKLATELKGVKNDLTAQEKNTSAAESSNKKYLSALMGAQGLLNSLVTTVGNALGEIPDVITADKETKVKKEAAENGK